MGFLRFPRREKKKQETRHRVIRAAGRLFEEKGYGEATMAEIAAAADIHVTTLFTHFKSKRELGEAVADLALDGLAELIVEHQGKTPFFQFQRELVSRIAESYARNAPFKLTIGRAFGRDPNSPRPGSPTSSARSRCWPATSRTISVSTRRTTGRCSWPTCWWAATSSPHRRWVESGGASDLKGESLAVLDAVERIVAGGLDAAGQHKDKR